MKTQIDFIRYSRDGIIKLMDELSLAQINTVPEGYNNNLAWQLGHLVVTLKVYCYGGAGREIMLGQSMIDMYGHGSKPERDITQEEFVMLKNLADNTLEQFEQDLANNLFAKFEPKTLGNGIQLDGINDAVEMMVFHEAMHLGECKMLKRAVTV